MSASPMAANGSSTRWRATRPLLQKWAPRSRSGCFQQARAACWRKRKREVRLLKTRKRQQGGPMRTRLFAAIPVAAIAVVFLVIGLTGNASAGGRPLHADLSGANEVPAADPNGTGTADLTLNQGRGRICLDIETQNIATPILQHIHRGVAGTNGPIVVDFTSLLAGGGDGCVSADRALVKAIRKNPQGYYFNVHSTEFPGGAVRGQLEK